jgi:hypothetical protein
MRLLAGADAIGFTTTRGGLLRLIKDFAAELVPYVSLGEFWNHALAPATSGDLFRSLFHIVVGLLMAVFYAFVL